jgi:hypothetical protein
MGYSRGGGSEEGAFLIFAHNIKEAKRIAWPALSGTITDEFTDMAVKYLKDSDYLITLEKDWAKKKYEAMQAFVIDSPVSCERCELWGVGVLDENGRCDDCAEEIRFDEEFFKKQELPEAQL